MKAYKTVAELLRDPKRWTQYVSWRDRRGQPTDDPKLAVRMCLWGAVSFVYFVKAGFVEEKIRREVRSQYSSIAQYGSISAWNDAKRRTHAEVLALARRLKI